MPTIVRRSLPAVPSPPIPHSAPVRVGPGSSPQGAGGECRRGIVLVAHANQIMYSAIPYCIAHRLTI